eukprot:4692125-Amphidinium_carterae.2
MAAVHQQPVTACYHDVFKVEESCCQRGSLGLADVPLLSAAVWKRFTEETCKCVRLRQKGPKTGSPGKSQARCKETLFKNKTRVEIGSQVTPCDAMILAFERSICCACEQKSLC